MDGRAPRSGRGWRAAVLRWLVLAVVAVSLAVWPGSGPAAAGDAGGPADAAVPELTLFYGDGCPYCAAEKEFLDDLQSSHPDLVVHEYEVWKSAANQRRLLDMARAAGVGVDGVPVTFFGAHVWVGFDGAVGEDITAAVEAAFAGRPVPAQERTTIDVPFVGPVDVGGWSLIVSTLLIGLVDGVNPCSLWVLSILLAVVLHSGSRRRVLLVGTVFLAVTSSMYGLYMAGAYSVLSYVRALTWIQRAVAVVAATLGVLQLKDVVAFHRGPTLGVPTAAKPGMYQRMRRLAAPDRPVPAVLGATAALAVGVSLLETPCTLGLPLLWTNLLRQHDVAALGAAVLFLLYLVAFLVDEVALFAAAVVTMRAVKLQERHGRELKLVSGVLLLSLALVMIARPELMESVGGALAVFAGAGLVVAVGLVTERALARA